MPKWGMKEDCAIASKKTANQAPTAPEKRGTNVMFKAGFSRHHGKDH